MINNENKSKLNKILNQLENLKNIISFTSLWYALEFRYEYDNLKNIKDLETKYPLKKINSVKISLVKPSNKFEKIEHLTPMLSLSIRSTKWYKWFS